MGNDLSVVILTENEEVNIAAAVGSVAAWAESTYVVDSFSRDDTQTVAKAHGATVVEHRFRHWADQRNWALARLPIVTSWILFLDADEWIPESTRREIDERTAHAGPEVAGFRVRFDYRFLGRSIRRSFDSHAVVRIVRRGRAHWTADGAREYSSTDGGILDLAGRIVHEDRKGLVKWIEKQGSNAVREAEAMLASDRAGNGREGAPPERKVRAWLRRHVYRHLPLFVRPLAYFVYRYLFRLAFLEGRPGLVYCVLHGFWYHFLVDAMYYERKTKQHRQEVVKAKERIAAGEGRVPHNASASG